jgi:hypothetical protein
MTWKRGDAKGGPGWYWLTAGRSGVVGTVQYVTRGYRMYLVNRAGDLAPVSGEPKSLAEAKEMVEKAYAASRRPVG